MISVTCPSLSIAKLSFAPRLFDLSSSTVVCFSTISISQYCIDTRSSKCSVYKSSAITIDRTGSAVAKSTASPHTASPRSRNARVRPGSLRLLDPLAFMGLCYLVRLRLPQTLHLCRARPVRFFWALVLTLARAFSGLSFLSLFLLPK